MHFELHGGSTRRRSCQLIAMTLCGWQCHPASRFPYNVDFHNMTPHQMPEVKTPTRVWVQALCSYSDRSRIKCLRTLPIFPCLEKLAMLIVNGVREIIRRFEFLHCFPERLRDVDACLVFLMHDRTVRIW